MLAHSLSTLLNLDLDYLQVSELAFPEVRLILLTILHKTRLHVLNLILFVLDVHISNTFLGTPSLLFSLKSLLLNSKKFLGFTLEDSLFVKFHLISKANVSPLILELGEIFSMTGFSFG